MAPGPMIASIVLLLPMLAMLVIGFILIIAARRGPRTGFPSCGACQYNLSGSVGSVARCPECGADFKEVGITPPRGASSRTMMIAGIALIVLPITCVGGILALTMLTVSGSRAPTTPSQPAPLNLPAIDVEPTAPRPEIEITPADMPEVDQPELEAEIDNTD